MFLVRRWEKIVDNSEELAYGESGTPRIIRAFKWERGWAIETGREAKARGRQARLYVGLENYTNMPTKVDAKRVMFEYIAEQSASKRRRG